MLAKRFTQITDGVKYYLRDSFWLTFFMSVVLGSGLAMLILLIFSFATTMMILEVLGVAALILFVFCGLTYWGCRL